jgi:hypothetical protein
MKLPLFITLCFALTAVSAWADESRCQPPKEGEKIAYLDDFHWGQSREDMKKNFETQYNSGKRLFGRAHLDTDGKTYIFSEPYGKIKLNKTFIASVRRHIEIALDRGYAESIFFPDMGHSHLYIPESDWPALDKIDARNKFYEAVFSLKSLRILYHTAEQLQVREGERSQGPFPQDPMLLWRYFARNVFGDNGGGENVSILFEQPPAYNTVSDVKGYHVYSAGFYLSASKDGCFAYEHGGKTYYFDIAVAEMPSDPNNGTGGT